MGPLCQATEVVEAHSEMPFDHKGSIILLRRSAWKSDYSRLVQSFDNIVGALFPNINMHILLFLIFGRFLYSIEQNK